MVAKAKIVEMNKVFTVVQYKHHISQIPRTRSINMESALCCHLITCILAAELRYLMYSQKPAGYMMFSTIHSLSQPYIMHYNSLVSHPLIIIT